MIFSGLLQQRRYFPPYWLEKGKRYMRKKLVMDVICAFLIFVNMVNSRLKFAHQIKYIIRPRQGICIHLDKLNIGKLVYDFIRQYYTCRIFLPSFRPDPDPTFKNRIHSPVMIQVVLSVIIIYIFYGKFMIKLR